MSMVHELSLTKRRVAGIKQVLRFARAGLLEKVYIAKDADEQVIKKALDVCIEYAIPFDTAYTMHQIGSACGLDVGSACAGVLKTS